METRLKRLEEEGNPEMKKLTDKIDQLTTSVNEYTDQIRVLEATVSAQEVIITTLTDKVEELEHRHKVHNLVIEGVSESADENVRSTIDKLFEDLELEFGAEWCDLIYRMGKKKQTTNRPRPIFVSFAVYQPPQGKNF